MESTGYGSLAYDSFRFLTAPLSDWPDCSVEQCCCWGTAGYRVRLLPSQHRNQTFGQLLARLRCKRCQSEPAPVYLCAANRSTPPMIQES